MARTIKQFVINNSSIGTNLLEYEATRIGIQALPGTKFVLNDNDDHNIIIGHTGLYELDVEGLTSINSLKFTHIIKNSNVIVDVLYDTTKSIQKVGEN